MKTVNALKLRTKFGQVLSDLKKENSPIYLSRGKKLEAVLVPIELFRERFVDLLGRQAIEELISSLDRIRAKPTGKRPTQVDLRETRGDLL